MEKGYKNTVLACIVGFISQAVSYNALILFFNEFKASYGLSDTIIGYFLLVGSTVQIIADLLSGVLIKKFGFKFFAFFCPSTILIGLIFYIVSPLISSSIIIGLMLGQVFISIGAGFFEIIVNSIVFNLPVENKEKYLALIHGSYSFGFTFLIIINSIFNWQIGTGRWQTIVSFWLILPILTIVIFLKAKMPENGMKKNPEYDKQVIKDKYFKMCILLLFFVGAAEVMMTQWMSSFVERAVPDMPKYLLDIIAVGGFSIGIAMNRIIHSKFFTNKSIEYVLIVSIAATLIIFTILSFSYNKYVVIICCLMSGFSISMLWPGTLILSAKKFPMASSLIYTILCTAGDITSAIAPWAMGKISDSLQNQKYIVNIAQQNGNISVDNVTMRMGILLGVVFLVVALIICVVILRMRNKGKIEVVEVES